MTGPIKSAGFFFESHIPVFLLNGHYYAANGWNGEEYLDSWECVDFKYCGNTALVIGIRTRFVVGIAGRLPT